MSFWKFDKTFKRHHPESIDKINEKRSNVNVKQQEVQQNLNNFITKRKLITLEMTADEMINICVELVTVNGFPITAIESSALKKIFDPITEALGITINRHNIRDHIKNKANLYIDAIRKEVQGKIISLKIDSATRLERSILAINIQYEKNNKIIKDITIFFC